MAAPNQTVVWARWAWRQLTSMRVALMLLLALAIVSIPGSLFPQRPQDPVAVAQYLEANPGIGPVLDRMGFFNVYGSAWFAAVYLLLFISLTGCILPRIVAHVRALRTPPGRVPSRLDRYEAHQVVESELAAEEAAAQVASRLRGYRIRRDGLEITAERGHLRETGNLLFHVALVGILWAFAFGQLATYRGQAIVVEGESFANSVLDYDSFESGVFVDEDALPSFRFTLQSMTAEFSETGRPLKFAADVLVSEAGGAPQSATIIPNEPLRSGGTAVYLSGNGYAPRIEVRDRSGEIAFSGTVPFLPQDDQYTSTGVIKVPDVSSGPQIGFEGLLLPTAVQSDAGLVSAHPAPQNPLLVLDVWQGDLGLDEGIPQNVYRLQTDALTPAGIIAMAPGETVQLPDGLGEITFVDLPRFAALDLRHDPSLPWLLVAAVAAMVGLMGSLFLPRRKVWVRVHVEETGSRIEAAALAGREHTRLEPEISILIAGLGKDQ